MLRSMLKMKTERSAITASGFANVKPLREFAMAGADSSDPGKRAGSPNRSGEDAPDVMG